MGRLEIRVCGARNIGNVQKIGTPDPYVRVKMGDKKKTQIHYKTRVVESSLNPVWNELFKFQVADYDTTQILFEVWNDNILVDDLLGSYRLSLNGLKKGVVEDTWAILTGAKISSAELHLRVLAVDFGHAPAAGDTVIQSIEQDNLSTPANQTYRPTKEGANGGTYTVVSPQGLPQTVTYPPQYIPTAPQQPAYVPVAPQPVYYSHLPPQAPPPRPAYNTYAPPPQPMYAPQPMYPPRPQPMYGPPPMQSYGPPPPQMAYGVPPDM